MLVCFPTDFLADTYTLPGLSTKSIPPAAIFFALAAAAGVNATVAGGIFGGSGGGSGRGAPTGEAPVETPGVPTSRSTAPWIAVEMVAIVATRGQFKCERQPAGASGIRCSEGAREQARIWTLERECVHRESSSVPPLGRTVNGVVATDAVGGARSRQPNDVPTARGPGHTANSTPSRERTRIGRTPLATPSASAFARSSPAQPTSRAADLALTG